MLVQSVSEQLFFTTVIIEVQTPDGKLGIGTAFIFSFTQDGNQYLFLVTNKHVIRDAEIGKFFFTVMEADAPVIGRRFDLRVDNFEARWFGHPDDNIDIAIMPLVPILNEIGKAGIRVFYRAIEHSLIPNNEQLQQLDAIEEVFFIGYPDGIFDTTNLMPVVRRGTTASPLQIDYEGQPMFLIDASVFPGSSGSPVLIVNTGGYSNRGRFVVGTRVYFLGVISQVFYREENGRISYKSIPSTKVPVVTSQEMLDLGVVFKASAVLETVQEFIKQL